MKKSRIHQRQYSKKLNTRKLGLQSFPLLKKASSAIQS